jgi:predicted phosphodiesterase
MKRILVIADTQHPFQHEDYLAFLKAVAKKFETNTVVHVGDEVDHHALSDFDKDPDGMSAGDELKKAIDELKPYYKAFPKMYLCESNHTSRIFRKAYKVGILRPT